MIGGGNAVSEEKIKGMPIAIAQCPMLRWDEKDGEHYRRVTFAGLHCFLFRN